MRKIITLSFVLIVTLMIAGCGDHSRPKDLPPLYPCSLTVTQEGQPLDGAVVDIISVDTEHTKYQASSVTNADGKADISTYGFPGMPSGRYKVVVTKNVEEGMKPKKDGYGDTIMTGGTPYRTVEPKYSNTKTTPHEIEITGKDKATATFDVGKAIKKRL